MIASATVHLPHWKELSQPCQRFVLFRYKLSYQYNLAHSHAFPSSPPLLNYLFLHKSLIVSFPPKLFNISLYLPLPLFHYTHTHTNTHCMMLIIKGYSLWKKFHMIIDMTQKYDNHWRIRATWFNLSARHINIITVHFLWGDNHAVNNFNKD